ncbi:MAG: hypothetical protein LC689_09365 [Myxococcales bacterium]|nr:hypothetical protein [Myxococcales bacterium]
MWSLPRRLAFRIFAAFVVLDSAPWPLGSLPRSAFVRTPFRAIADVLVPWFGRHVLGVTVARIENGSGDTLFHWVSLATTAVAALLVAAIWSALDRNRNEYATAFRWLRVYVRLLLATALLNYGVIKILGGQFPALDAYRLVEPLGQMSPMGLLWTTLGFSRAYQAFAGWCELSAGLLLLSGRTASAGALIAAAVLGNVVMVNFSFDVPVKIFSTELLVYALFVLLPDLPFLAKSLVLRRPASLPEVEPPAFERRWTSRLAQGAVLLATFVPLYIAWQSARGTLRWVKKNPPLLAGVWTVDRFDGSPRARPWRTIAISNWGAAIVRYQDETSARMSFTEVGWDSHEIVLLPRDPAGPTINGDYQQPDPSTLVFRVSIENTPTTIRMRKLDGASFPLVLRGFHWVNDAPYNR